MNNKSILKIDTPKSCRDCWLHYEGATRLHCTGTPQHFVIPDKGEGIATFCPLKPVSYKMPNVNPPPPPRDQRPMKPITPPPAMQKPTVSDITLRDCFAGQWLTGPSMKIVSIKGMALEENLSEEEVGEVIKNLATDAYRIADAMLAERDKEPEVANEM